MIYAHIYLITNTVTNQRYVGLTRSNPPVHRWNVHKYNARHNVYPKTYLYRAINKYGVDNFVFEVIDQCSSKNKMNAMEREYISSLKTHYSKGGYNVELGGNGSGKRDRALIKRILKTHKDRGYLNPVDKYDLSGKFLASFDSTHAAAREIGDKTGTGAGIRNCCNGVSKSAYDFVYRYKGDDFNKYTVKDKPYLQPVTQIDPSSNKVLATFKSIAQANRSVGVRGNASNISRVCRGVDHCKTAYGFKWGYL